MLVDATDEIAALVEQSVAMSLGVRPLRNLTQAEIKRRVQICERIWRVLRLEHKWSIQRIGDHMFRFLVSELDGVSWEPDHRSSWIVPAGRGNSVH